MNMNAWRHYLRAQLHQLFNKPELAITDLDAALRHDPQFARAIHRLAFLLGTQGNFERALPLLEQVVSLRPRDAGAWYNLGFASDSSHNPARAIDAFSEAVRLNPNFDQAWYGLGHCHAALDHLDEAVRTFGEAARLQPMKGLAWYELAMVHHRRHDADQVRYLAEYLNRFDRHLARKLIHDTGRSDLDHLVSDLLT